MDAIPSRSWLAGQADDANRLYAGAGCGRAGPAFITDKRLAGLLKQGGAWGAWQDAITTTYCGPRKREPTIITMGGRREGGGADRALSGLGLGFSL